MYFVQALARVEEKFYWRNILLIKSTPFNAPLILFLNDFPIYKLLRIIPGMATAMIIEERRLGTLSVAKFKIPLRYICSYREETLKKVVLPLPWLPTNFPNIIRNYIKIEHMLPSPSWHPIVSNEQARFHYSSLIWIGLDIDSFVLDFLFWRIEAIPFTRKYIDNNNNNQSTQIQSHTGILNSKYFYFGRFVLHQRLRAMRLWRNMKKAFYAFLIFHLITWNKIFLIQKSEWFR